MAKHKGKQLPVATQRPSGSWVCRVQVTAADGSTVRKFFTRSTKREAEAAAAAFKFSAERPQTVRGDARTLRQICNAWIAKAEKRPEPLSPSTLAGYDVIIRHRAQGLMDRPVGSITAADWQEAMDADGRRYASKTVRNAYSFFDDVLHDETGRHTGLDLPSGKGKRRSFLDYEEIDRTVEAIRGDPMEVPILLALCSLRRSEILALDWEHVDLRKRLLYVRAAVVADKKGNMVKKGGKTDASFRTFPIIDPLYDALAAVEHKHGPVCPGMTTHISARIRTALRRCGLREVTCHELRHSFASLARHLGADEALTAEMGGWKDLGTMRKIYTHIAEQDKEHFQGAFTEHFKRSE